LTQKQLRSRETMAVFQLALQRFPRHHAGAPASAWLLDWTSRHPPSSFGACISDSNAPARFDAGQLFSQLQRGYPVSR
jgi:hypothetical protein